MYADPTSFKNFALALINYDESFIADGKILDPRLFFFAKGIISDQPELFDRITLGESLDISVSSLARALYSGKTQILEPIKLNTRCYSVGHAIIENSKEHLDSLIYDQNLYGMTKTLITGDPEHLELITKIDLFNFLSHASDEEFSGIKNVVWDESFHLKCLMCKDIILPDNDGYFHYYFSSSENRVSNQITIYFKETYRHRFYKFCSSECCNSWLG
jgi:hypothetical protein